MRCAQNHWPFLFLLATYTLVLVSFPLSIQAMESYAYAASAEGYYNLANTFAIAAEGARIPDFSQYHPNHPLPHLIASVLYRSTGISALKLFRAMNFAGAMIFLCLHYAVALRLYKRSVPAVLSAALCASTYAIWASALSGEVQMFSLALLMAGYYFFLVYLQAPTDTANSRLRIAGVLYVMAVAFHQAAFFSGISAAFAALLKSRKRQSLWLYAQVAFIILAGWAFFYIFLLVQILSIGSLQEYMDTLFVYRHILVKEYGSVEWFKLLFGAAMRSVTFADFGISHFIALSFFLASVAGFWKMFRSDLPKPVWVLLAGLPLVQIAVQLLVRGRPEGINFWLFLIPVFALAIFYSQSDTREQLPGILFSSLLVVLVGLLNFCYFFLPNYRFDPQDSAYTRGVSAPKNLPLAIVVHEPVLTFIEGWSLGSESGLRTQTWFFPCCSQKDFEQKLAHWIAEHREFLLLADDIHRARQWLPEDRLETQILLERRGLIPANILPRSLYVPSTPDEQYQKEVLLVRARHRTKTTKP